MEITQAEIDLAYLKKTPLEMVREFHAAMGQTLDYPAPKSNNDFLYMPPYEREEYFRLRELRDTLIDEEHKEVIESTTTANLLKELADLIYVTYGYAATFGWDLDEAVRRVHQSNMSKLDDNGDPVYRADGKVMKGPNYKAPDLEDLIV